MAELTGSSKTVAQVEPEGAVVVSQQTTVLQACKMMSEKDVASVVVVDESGLGITLDYRKQIQILGIMTVKDVTNRVIGKGLDPAKTLVSKVMTSPVQTVGPETSLYKVALLMNKNDFKQVPLVDSGKIKGMVTSRVINMSIIEDIINDIKLMASIFR